MSTIDRKLTLNLIVIFTSFTNVSFLKHVPKIFCISTIVTKKFACVSRCSSQRLSVYILLSKGANHLQVLYVRTLKNIQENVMHDILSYWSYSPQMYYQLITKFLEICRRFRTRSQKTALENYVLAYHTADKDNVKVL